MEWKTKIEFFLQFYNKIPAKKENPFGVTKISYKIKKKQRITICDFPVI